MDNIGPAGRVTSTTGNVDPDGDVVGSLLERVRERHTFPWHDRPGFHERLRAQVGQGHSSEIDPDEQARLAAGLVLNSPLRPVQP